MAYHRICIVDGCGKDMHAHELCGAHYRRLRLYGSPATLLRHGEINTLTDEAAAYIAGLIDADGTITSTRQRDRHGGYYMPKPLVLIVNGHFPLIEWLTETVGAGCAYFTKGGAPRPDQDQTRWNPVHRYQLTGLKAITLIERCLPHLIVKKERAIEMVRMPMRGRDYRNHSEDRHRLQALAIHDALRLMNKRGLKAEAA